MTVSGSPSTSMPAPQALNDDEIDLRQVAGSLQRQSRLIVGIAAASLGLAALYAFTRPPVWEGQFQIVLQNNDSGAGGRLAQLAADNPMLANLAGVSGGTSDLETEVKILESPSVLKPIFTFVKTQKEKAGQNVSKLTFTDWLPSLSVELEKGTSVLNIAYRDTDEDLVLPVIDRISKAYQQYSGRDRSRGLSQGVTYLEQQLQTLRPKAEASMRAAQNFALANGLGVQDGLGAGVATDSSGTQGGGSVEASREAAQNKVNALKQQLASARAAGGTRVYVAPQLEANAELYGQLQNLEAQLQEKSALLRSNDPAIQALQRQRRSLTLVINQQTIGLLQGELQTAQAQLASLSRPRDVILKHRELVRTAIRDEKTVTEMETKLQTLQLEKARQTDPWELISTPTLLDKPVAPRKARIMALGLLAGLVVGSGAALVVDRRTGLVFSTDELQAALPCPLLKHLPANNDADWSDAIDLLARGPLATAELGTIALIPVGDLDNDQVQKFAAALKGALVGRQLIVSDDLVATQTCVTQLLLTSPGAATRSELSQLSQKLALQGTPIAGWVLLDPRLSA